MRNKTLIVLSIGFLSQTIISCCNCGDSSTYENYYSGVTVTPYNNSGFYPQIAIATDTVYRNAFGLGIEVNFESKLYSDQTLGFGFNSAMALSCDCEGDEYIYPDPIDFMEIFVTNQTDGQTIDVSDHFQIYGYTGELMTLDDFFAQRERWHDGFQIELVNYDSVPESAIFKAEVFLESGKSFVGQTNIVNFF